MTALPRLLVALSLAALAPVASAQDPKAPAPAREIRAQLVAVDTAVISAELAGKIELLPFKDGERFKTGDVLAALDCAIHRARLSKAEAALDRTTKKLRTSQRLGEMKSIGALEIDLAAAEQAEAAAEVRFGRATVERCTIKAPYDGRVVAAPAKRYQYIGEGQPLIEIVSEGALEIELLLPSRWLSFVKPGYRFDVEIDETGKPYPVEVTRISGRVDPVSQSVRIYAVPAGRFPELLAGMSGRARITPPTPS
ncbi:MAG: efflux transporter periplasmic adaptor subunit [Rhodospirillales bacterium]|nr:efflux transporter periplasmic adaptor subunit [Rhodospirillales bacterium]